MGNCCGKSDVGTSQSGNVAFQGQVRQFGFVQGPIYCTVDFRTFVFFSHFSQIQGHRLGEGTEVTPLSGNRPSGGTKASDETPPPRIDPSMTDEEREQQRKERIAAAEARLKKAGGLPKKKKEYKDMPLTGPNTKPTMTWTAG